LKAAFLAHGSTVEARWEQKGVCLKADLSGGSINCSQLKSIWIGAFSF